MALLVGHARSWWTLPRDWMCWVYVVYLAGHGDGGAVEGSKAHDVRAVVDIGWRMYGRGSGKQRGRVAAAVTSWQEAL